MSREALADGRKGETVLYRNGWLWYETLPLRPPFFAPGRMFIPQVIGWDKMKE